jgi:hypothetical protein
MAGSSAGWVIAVIVAIVLVLAGVAVYYYVIPHPGQVQHSENWSGFIDRTKVTSASGTITVPASTDFSGNGTTSFWVGMGGDAYVLHPAFPFWQAGLSLTWWNFTYEHLGIYVQEVLWTEGGSGQSSLCGGSVCPVNWTHTVALVEYGTYVPSLTLAVSLHGTAAGANATLTLTVGTTTTTFYPPEWAPLAGTLTFPSAEWIQEAPSSIGYPVVMPVMQPPGATFASCTDSAGLTVLGSVLMTLNPHDQSIALTPFSGGGFSSYSYNE